MTNVVTVFESIKNLIITSANTGKIKDAVIQVFVDRENDRRIKLITQGLEKLTSLQIEYEKINKSDNKVFVGPEKTPQETFSEKRISEISKAKKNVDELTQVINKALAPENTDSIASAFDALDKVLKKSGKPEGSTSQSDQ